MFQIPLDIQTLSITLFLVASFITFVIIFVRLTQKTYDGFGLWMISNIAIASGIFLLAIDNVWTDIIGTSLTFSAVLIGYEGNRRFLNLNNSWLFSLLFLSLNTAALLFFKFYFEDTVLQISFTSLLVGIISGVCGFIFTTNVSEKTKFSYKFTGITYFVFAVIMVFRALITYFTGDNDDFYKADGIQPLFFIIYIMFEIVWTFNYINLNSNRLYNELEDTRTELEKLATTDFLTGISNNRNFYEISQDEIKRANRSRYPLSLVMFDLDYFKTVNDEYGHAAGDKVLTSIADLCAKLLRTTDTFGRLGGEEFAILLPDTDNEGAHTLAEFLRAAVEEHATEFDSKIIKISASFGVTELRGNDDQIQTMLDRADKSLYQAKEKGRNMVVSDNGVKIYKKLAVA